MQGNKGWYKADVRTATMEQWGRRDLYASFKSVQSLPYGQAVAITKRFEGMDPDNVSDKDLAEMFETVIGLIVEWHMENPITGEDMPRPKKAEDLKDIPMDVLMHMANTALQQEETVPLTNET